MLFCLVNCRFVYVLYQLFRSIVLCKHCKVVMQQYIVQINVTINVNNNFSTVKYNQRRLLILKQTFICSYIMVCTIVEECGQVILCLWAARKMTLPVYSVCIATTQFGTSQVNLKYLFNTSIDNNKLNLANMHVYENIYKEFIQSFEG